MRKSIISLILILIGFQSFSQGTIPTIEITTLQAKEAIRNAQRVEYLSLKVSFQSQTIIEYKGLTEELKAKIANRENQLNLLQGNYDRMKSLYDSERLKKEPGYSFKDLLNDIALVGVGVVIGVVLIL